MAEYNFYHEYPGPHGPHLDAMTMFTRTRKHLDPKLERSIHPFGRKSGHDVSKRKKKSTLQRAIAGISEHLERHPDDAMSKARLASFEARLARIP